MDLLLPPLPQVSRHSLPQSARGEQLRDEVDGEVFLVQPAVVEGHDVLVLQLLQHPDLCKQPLPLCWRIGQVIHFDLVPGHLDALSLIKGLEHGLECAPPQHSIILQCIDSAACQLLGRQRYAALLNTPPSAVRAAAHCCTARQSPAAAAALLYVVGSIKCGRKLHGPVFAPGLRHTGRLAGRA